MRIDRLHCKPLKATEQSTCSNILLRLILEMCIRDRIDLILAESHEKIISTENDVAQSETRIKSIEKACLLYTSRCV